MTLDDLCNGLVYAQRQRVFCIKSQSRCDRSIEALIASLLGFRTDSNASKGEGQPLSEEQRKKLFNQAKTIRVKIEKAERGFDFSQWGEQIAGLAPMIWGSADARRSWDDKRREIEAKMEEVAPLLPAWPFVESVKGFSARGLAVIVGEAGNLANYATPAKLWKRLGLAVMEDGGRQGLVPKHITGDARNQAWKDRGYVGRRRAEVWAFVDDVMFRAQWRGEKDGVPAHPIGPYGEIYGNKKAEYRARGMTPGHADRAARRYMAKQFLVDLWRAWKANAVVDVPIDRSLFYRRALSTGASDPAGRIDHEAPQSVAGADQFDEAAE